MTETEELAYLKARIASVFAQREALKADLSSGKLRPRQGFAALETVDAELSALDSRFKALWDKQNAHSSK